MGLTLAEKIIYSHIKGYEGGKIEKGTDILLDIDYTLTQDATGTMAYLELMNMGIDRVKTKLSVSYVDHNTLQNGFENADDHLFLKTVASKYGVKYSKAGNGICHQLELERFTVPGITLLGSDSHTPTSGALAAIAIGAGGLDVALAMAGKPFRLLMPEIVNVRLTGKLRNGVESKDIILYILGKLTAAGGTNRVFEYTGDGVKTLSVPQRATICNMGAELGATTSVFPSDDETRRFLRRQEREGDYERMAADPDAEYGQTIDVDLGEIEALAACPYNPDVIKPVRELAGMKVDQVLIGSCTNSSYEDMVKVASVLRGRKINENVSFGINPGSRQVLAMMAESGVLHDIIESGARILECTCGACIGMGQAPATDGVSLRTYNRNFLGRSGTRSAKVYLVSPVVAAMSAVEGCFTDPTGTKMRLDLYANPEQYEVDDSMFLEPRFDDNVIMGPNIMPLPAFEKLPERIDAKIALKLPDNISTDHIMPAGSKVLPFRSNIEKLSDFCFGTVDPDFKKRAREMGTSVILAADNYGQGSSREHAAIAPRYLGVRAVMAKSFARIHKQNLINFGIVPLVIGNDLYDFLEQGDDISLGFEKLGENVVTVSSKGRKFEIKTSFTEEEMENLRKGALLNNL